MGRGQRPHIDSPVPQAPGTREIHPNPKRRGSRAMFWDMWGESIKRNPDRPYMTIHFINIYPLRNGGNMAQLAAAQGRVGVLFPQGSRHPLTGIWSPWAINIMPLTAAFESNV